MAIAHRLRGAGDFELNRAAKAFSCEAHEYFLVGWQWAGRAGQCPESRPGFRLRQQSSGQPHVLDSRDQSQALHDGPVRPLGPPPSAARMTE
jgi:hypothetical protein